MRQDQREELGQFAVRRHDAADHADIHAVAPEQVDRWDAEKDAQAQCTCGNDGVVGPHVGGEVGRRMRGVVVLEVMRDELADVGG